MSLDHYLLHPAVAMRNSFLKPELPRCDGKDVIQCFNSIEKVR